ncbi:hypothetical protein BaRGS_00002809 [Batillaria attramentaria]|uniref:Uncharacterized protein n=1 Tax=Batillaria attramentaria TaxID=370345 RepID=A0ABD0M304_9CAEN
MDFHRTRLWRGRFCPIANLGEGTRYSVVSMEEKKVIALSDHNTNSQSVIGRNCILLSVKGLGERRGTQTLFDHSGSQPHEFIIVLHVSCRVCARVLKRLITDEPRNVTKPHGLRLVLALASVGSDQARDIQSLTVASGGDGNCEQAVFA